MAASTSRQQPEALPCLVFDYGEDGGEQRRPTTLYSVADGVHRPCEFEELRDKRSWVTSHGWVLTWDPTTLATFLWNPHAAGRRRIVLPSFGQTTTTPPPADSFCALSGKPTDDDGGGGFTVVMVEPPGSCFILFCHVGSSSSSPAAWVRHEYDIGTRKMDIEGRQRMKRSIHCITSCGGKLYHFIRSTAYGVLEFSPEPVFTTVRMKPASPFTTTDMFVASIFSVDVDGKLHLVFIFESGGGVVADVAVYRVDLEKRKHVRIGSIGDRAILVGGRRNDMGAAGWCRARRHGLLPNSIYWMNPGDRRLRVYELGKRTEEVRDPFKGVAESADGTWCRPYWMIPAHT
uniref:KIB1-4 beta-propeller domain-containing protein n=1 Tax=Oryza glaberrima TaxID=4538 RepID=I1PZB0_ORYGL